MTVDDFYVNNRVNDVVIGNDMLTGKPIFTTDPPDSYLNALFGGPAPDDQLPPYDVLPSNPGRFNGQLLTFVSGPASGTTARIVDHQVFTIADSALNNSNEVRY